jgi:hypothetical protein
MYTMNSLDIIFCSSSLMDEAWPNYNSFSFSFFFFFAAFTYCCSSLDRNGKPNMCNSSPVVIYREGDLVRWWWSHVCVCLCVLTKWVMGAYECQDYERRSRPPLLCPSNLENTHFQKSPNSTSSNRLSEPPAKNTKQEMK